MRLYPKTDKVLPNVLVWKVMACVMTLYIPMVMAMKFIAPLIYGATATRGLISQTEVAMAMPGFMIGIGLMALRMETASLKNLLIRSFLASILVSGLALVVGIPIFLNP